MKTILFALMGTTLFAQQSVSISQGPPRDGPYQAVYVYNGSNQLIGGCLSVAVLNSGIRAQTKVSISAASNATAAVLTSTGHGFLLGTRPSITISGATGNWTPINGTFVATVIDADTFSIPVNSTTFSTLAGTVLFTTTAPRQTMYEWAVNVFMYDGSGNLTGSAWLAGAAANQRCSDVTSSSVQLQ